MFNAIYTIFGTPLGWIMWLCYKVIPIYGIALILFTVIMKGALLPFAVKQKKASAKMAVFQPKIAEIQKKFATDKQKQQEAMMKLYEEEGYNPMGSCLPSLIQFPILFGLIDVIYKPMTHLLHIPAEVITQLTEIAKNLGVKNLEQLSAQINIMGSFIKNEAAYSAVSPDILTQLKSLNLTFLGIDFTAVPQLALTVNGSLNWLILLPLASGAAALAQSIYMMRVNPMQAQGGNSTKMMMYIMPLFSVFIAFSFPAGLSFYWTLSSLLGLLQEVFLNRIYNPQKMIEEVKAEQEARKAQRKNVKHVAAAAVEGEAAPISLTQKELDRKRLAEARKRDAERYGEVYVDVSDDDLK